MMQTELFTVSRIFTESLYRIPDYQRGYAWQQEQLKDFWLDLEQLEDEDKHYTGVLTLESVPDKEWGKWDDDRWIIKSRRYKPYYVVDGQQRLTTVIVLLQSIVDICSNAQLNFTPIEDIRRKYIYDSKPEMVSRSYIFGYEKDNPSYEYLKKVIFQENSDHHSPDEDTIYTKNLLAAKSFFQGQLKDFTKTQLETIFTKVTQQLVFNVYEITNDIDVFVTFETMNNRGKPLSTLELLKNRLIFLSTKLKNQDGDGTDIRRAINDAWKTTYHYLGKNDDRPLRDDDFLRTHLAYYYPKYLVKISERSDDETLEKAERRFSHTIEEFSRFLLNELFTPKRIHKTISKGRKKDDLPELTQPFLYSYSQHIKASIETYYKLSTPKDSQYSAAEKVQLERLGRLQGFNHSSLVLAVYTQEKDAKKRVQLLEQLERYFFCHTLSNRNISSSMRKLGAPNFYIDYISGKTTIEELTTLFSNMVSEIFREVPLHDQLLDWVKNGPSYYGWRSIKYFLYEYEIHLQEQVRSTREKIVWREFSRENYDDEYETIEHIYPQRARDRYWTDRFSKFSPSQKRLIRNSLGNLLALARPRNSSLGNKSFPDKLGNESTKTGYRYGSYSENEVALSSEWNIDQIVERGIKLLEFLEKRWKLPIGDDNQKIRALGLDFISKFQVKVTRMELKGSPISRPASSE